MVGQGCSEEEISKIRSCHPPKNIPDGGHRERVDIGLASSSSLSGSERFLKKYFLPLHSLPTSSEVEGWGVLGLCRGVTFACCVHRHPL